MRNIVPILLSEIAADPLEDNSLPIISCMSLLFLLASFEVLSSFFSIKSSRFRKIVDGSSVMVIKKGEVLQKNLRELRFSIDDLLEALRLKDVFDINEVDFAYIETNGSLSIKLKNNSESDEENSSDGSIPYVVVSDGKIVEDNFIHCNMNSKKLKKTLDKKRLNEKDIYLMTADSRGKLNIIMKQVTPD